MASSWFDGMRARARSGATPQTGATPAPPRPPQNLYQQWLQRQQPAAPAPGANPPGPAQDADWWNPADPQGSVMRLLTMGGREASSDTLLYLGPILAAQGIRLERPNAAGITSKIIFPDGRIFRVGNFFDGGGTPSWGMTEQPTGGGGGGGDGLSDDESLLEPWTETFKHPGFTPPDPSKIGEDPVFKFRFAEGMKSLQRSAAARGTLLSGGTLKDFEQFGSDLASTEYDKQYGRSAAEWATGYNKALGEYEQRYNISEANQGKRFNRLYQMAQLGANETNALNSLGYGNPNGTGNQGDYITGNGNANAAAGIAGSNAWRSAYTNAYNTWYSDYLRRNPRA